jgi:hypothetical protein
VAAYTTPLALPRSSLVDSLVDGLDDHDHGEWRFRGRDETMTFL